MVKLEMFFDYACPYCLKGYELLLELLPQYPEIEMEWHPCEAHPRPESHGLHSDLCARGMYHALACGADLLKYHRTMYQAALKDHVDIEDLSVVSKLTDGLLDPDDFYNALSSDKYIDELLDNNQLAWDKYSFPAVPSFRMNGNLLKAVGGVGVTKQLLVDFIEQNK